MNKKEEIEELNKTLEIIFNKNIAYLQNNHPILFKRLVKFEETNPNNYAIDFENNRFELVYKNEKTYNCDPFYDASCRVEALKKNDATISLINIEKQKELLHTNYELEANNIINEYINSIQKNKKDNEKPKSKKFIFIGTLLGVHLNDINKLVQANSYLIIEPSFEIFKLSMFLTDYTELALTSKLFFAIEEENLEEKINSFLKYKSEFNHFIRFEIASTKEVLLLEKISSLLIQEGSSLYPYSEYLLSLERGFDYFSNDFNFLQTNTSNPLLENLPILYLGAGPSLSKNEAFIKENQDKFLIVAIGATLKKLQTLNIIPQIIISTDSGGDNAVIKQFEVDKKMYENSIIISSIKTQKEIVELLPKESLYLVNDSFELFVNSGVNTGSTVGDVGYKLLAKLGAKEIYLLGFDASIDSKTGATHDESYYQTKHEINDFNIEKDDEVSSSKYLTKVKGNFKDEVHTTLLYKHLIKGFEQVNEEYQLNSFNLSNGAFIKGSKPFNEKIEKENITYNKDNFLEKLNNLKKEKLNSLDIKNIKFERKVLKQLKQNKDINKLFDKYPNSICLSLIKRFLDLINPYENYLEHYKKNLKLKDKYLKLLISKLEDIYEKTLV